MGVVLGTLLLLSACVEEEERVIEGEAPMADPLVQEEPVAAGLDTLEADTVFVVLANFDVEMRTPISAGPTVFRVSNEGNLEHGFAITGEGIEEALAAPLQPGETGMLRVVLEPGPYDVFCPVADHRERGMEMEIMVNEAGAGGPVE